jgi:hypothetical protein
MTMSTDDTTGSEMDPIFLELGKALYACQSLEVNLRALNAQLSRNDGDEEESMFGASLDFYSNESLGQLINNFRKRVDIPADVSDYFEAGLKIRNEIVHDSVTRDTQRFDHPKGRLEVEAELAFMRKEVDNRNILVNKLLNALLAKDELSADRKRNTQQFSDVINAISGLQQ